MKYRGFAVFALIVVIIGIGVVRRELKKPPGPKPGSNHLALEDQGPEPVEIVKYPQVVTDAVGRDVSLTAQPHRIVSLAPSVTELLYDLGAGPQIAADTTACDYPMAARSLPHIGGAFDMSLESIVGARPDLIVADGTINQKIVTALRSVDIPVIVIMPRNIEDSFTAIRLLGKATGNPKAAADMINQFRNHFRHTRDIVAHATARTRVLVMYDTSPIYTSGPGTLIDDMIRISGGKNIASSNDPIVSERVIQDQPDVIICSTELETKIAAMPAWRGTVPAVMNTAYFHPSDNATLIRPCNRLLQGANELARFLHPELFTSDGKPAVILKGSVPTTAAPTTAAPGMR